MNYKIPRPRGFITSQRATDRKSFSEALPNPPNINNQDYEQVRIARAHIFVTRRQPTR
jgi:hypothetical protein